MLNIQRIESISDHHSICGLPRPDHPLISVVDYSTIEHSPGKWVLDFYLIAIKRGMASKMDYRQQQYDFDEGVMFFISPNQVFGIEPESGSGGERSGWMLLIHPDFLWGTSLAKKIKNYEFFGYSTNEALFLSAREETVINAIVQTIQKEHHSNIDKFSQNIILSQLETLLNYFERFYERQFITRKITNHKILESFEDILNDSFEDDLLSENGLPTVTFIA